VAGNGRQEREGGMVYRRTLWAKRTMADLMVPGMGKCHVSGEGTAVVLVACLAIAYISARYTRMASGALLNYNFVPSRTLTPEALTSSVKNRFAHGHYHRLKTTSKS